MNRIDDGTLLQELRNEFTRELAFETLFKQLYTPLYQWVAKQTGQYHGAEDIVQEVFKDFWQQRPYEQSDIKSFSSFLMFACKRKVLNVVKKRSEHAIHDQKIGRLSPSMLEPKFGEDATRQIARLPRQQQKAVDLVILKGFPLITAAKVMGITDGALKTHLGRALKFLTSYYRPDQNKEWIT